MAGSSNTGSATPAALTRALTPEEKESLRLLSRFSVAKAYEAPGADKSNFIPLRHYMRRHPTGLGVPICRKALENLMSGIEFVSHLYQANPIITADNIAVHHKVGQDDYFCIASDETTRATPQAALNEPTTPIGCWALGLVLFEMATGAPVNKAEDGTLMELAGNLNDYLKSVLQHDPKNKKANHNVPTDMKVYQDDAKLRELIGSSGIAHHRLKSRLAPIIVDSDLIRIIVSLIEKSMIPSREVLGTLPTF